MIGATGAADIRHNRFRTAAEHTEHFDIGHMLVDFLGNQQFRFVEQTGNGAAVLDKVNRLFLYFGEVAAENGGTARLQKVGVLVAVYIVQISAFRFDHTHGERLVECQVVLYAARYVLFGLAGNGFGLCALYVVIILADIRIFFIGDAGYVLIGKFFEFCVDVLGARPAGYAVVGKISPGEISLRE